MDSQRIEKYLMDNTVDFINTYPLDGDLSTPKRALFALETIKP